MEPKFVELVVTCTSWQEAQRIADNLLAAHSIASAEFIEIKSGHWGEKTLGATSKVELIMQSQPNNFKKVETVVRELHSYRTPVLHTVPIARVTKAAAEWLNENAEDV